jgi:hypothetical protein
MRGFFIMLVMFVALAGALPAGAADSAEGVQAGRKIYLVKCARCHKFYNPAKYPDEAWRDWMDKMSKKAKLKPDQKEILSEYLQTFRTNSNVPTGARQ